MITLSVTEQLFAIHIASHGETQSTHSTFPYAALVQLYIITIGNSTQTN